MTTQQFDRRDGVNNAKPVIEELRVTPHRPRVGEDIIIELRVRNATSVTLFDHLGGCIELRGPFRPGKLIRQKVKARVHGRYLLEAEAVGLSGSVRASLEGWILRAIPKIDVAIPPLTVLNAPVIIEWETQGLDTLHVEHRLPWLKGFQPGQSLPLSGGVQFAAVMPGFHLFVLIGRTSQGLEFRKPVRLRVRSSDGFFEKGSQP